MKQIKNILILITFIFLSHISCKTLFVDMGGVLIKTSKIKALMHLGSKAIGHPDLKERFFEFINLIDKEKTDNQKATFNGLRLPSFMCKWQAGKMSCKELVDYIIDQTEKHPKFFKNANEKELIIESAKLLLPEKSVTVTKPIKEMVKTLLDCKNKKDKNGKPLNSLILTSNCDEETFESWKNKYPEVFEIFDKDKIIISGKIKMIKPNKDFFEYVLKKYKLNPKDCVLIDDQKENIEGAAKCGIDGILHKRTNKTIKQLKKIGAL